MQLYSINTGFFKLDGGAMFGVVPKTIWNKQNPADENNRCTWALRCLLVEINNQLYLIDNGIGNKLSPNFLKHYEPSHSLFIGEALQNLGFSSDDITHNIFTHLHFDHCGGGTQINPKTNKIETTFKNANYWIHQDHWQWARQPNPREKASFLADNLMPIAESGQLKFLNLENMNQPLIDFLYMDGHTEKQALPVIKFKDKTIVFAADLIPSVAHIPLPYVMGYDMRPLQTMQEKEKFLKRAAEEKYILYLQHDPTHECCTVEQSDKGVKLKDTFMLKDIL